MLNLADNSKAVITTAAPRARRIQIVAIAGAPEFKKWDCKIGESTICAGDTLALYTDGITESFNKQGEEFGEERLMECLRRNRELCSESLVSAIVDEVRVFSNASEQHDDITLIIAKSAGAADWKGN